ncbi:MAG TPA: chemotaxis protein CheB, partial [Planctomycetaceae bacterium]|nr:chemotaxis protein CheB [Planctomycetaceae bacterium]
MSSPDPVDGRGVTNAGKPSVGEAPTKPPFSVVGVGASAGGLEAFTRLLENLPPHPGVALVLVQHLDPSRESLLASILSKATPLPVS